MATEKTAIAMISIGDRPWVKKSGATFQHYCDRIGATFEIVSSYPSRADFPLPDLPDSPGRKNKLAYACKAYFAWDFLANRGFSRVVIVDDTCCVSPLAPDIFAAVPEGHCGFTGTSATHAEMSFETIRRFVEARGLEDVPYRTDRYMNSGVMVYDQASREAFHKDRIVEAADLLYARYPNQTLTYYLLMRAAVPMTRMPKAFNSLPASDIPKSERKQLVQISPYLKDGIFIYHVTGSFGNRQLIVEQIADELLARWRDPDVASPGHDKPRTTFNMVDYWEARHRARLGTPAARIGPIGSMKIRVVNRLYEQFGVATHMDFGCDDGRLLEHIHAERFVGVDISGTLLRNLKNKFPDESRWKFIHVKELDAAYPCDLVTSLDVVHHLVEDQIFAAYMKRLFKFATKVVCIYSSDHEFSGGARHVRYRDFAAYIAQHFPGWQLTETIENPNVSKEEQKLGIPPSRFFIYTPVSLQP